MFDDDFADPARVAPKGRQGDFFTVGRPQFARACTLGLNCAVAFLVLSRGTQKDHVTTSWSAEAISKWTGISWRRAKLALQELEAQSLITRVKKSTKPSYKLYRPKDEEDLLWLPNELVTGIQKVSPISPTGFEPVRRLRERQRLDLLEKFILLYGLQDLPGDRGLPRSLVRGKYTKRTLFHHGKFVLFAFEDGGLTANSTDLFAEYASDEDDDGNRGAWQVLKPLIDMKLIEQATYVVESDDWESEIKCPVTDEITDAFYDFADHLAVTGSRGFALNLEEALPYVCLALNDQPKTAMVEVFRLTYRPKTAISAAWIAQERLETERMVDWITALCSSTADIKGYQGVQGLSRSIK